MSGIGIGITGIARSSSIAGKRISNFLLSETALNATVTIGTTGPIGTIVIMIGASMGRLEGEHLSMIGWGADSVYTTDLRRWLMHEFPMNSYFAGMPIRIGWSQGKIIAQQQGKDRFLHGVQRG